MRGRFRVDLYMDISSDYQHGIARGVIRFANERGHWRLFGHGWTLDTVRGFARWQGDGVVAIVENRREAELLTQAGLPVVDVAGAVDHVALYQITNDDYQTGCLAGEHLLASGFRRFAFCGVSKTHWSDERRRGFDSALAAKGLSAAALNKPLHWWERPGNPRELQRFLKGVGDEIGVMAANDTAGVKVTGACREAGLSIPTQVAVVGVDNEDVLCELSTPSLSSIPCDCEHIGYEAASALNSLMKGERIKSPPVRIPPRPLVVRASSDTIVCTDPHVRDAIRFIRDNAHAQINVADVVRSASLCRRGLEVRFRAETGHTVLHEIQRTRVERSRRLLRDTSMPLGRIARASGFGGHHRFHAVFTRLAGVTPKAYRASSRP